MNDYIISYLCFFFSFLFPQTKTKQTFCCLLFFFLIQFRKKDFNSSFLKHLCQSFSCFFFFLSLFLFLFFFIPWHLTFVSEVTVCLNSNVPTMSDMYSVMLISSQLYRLGIITFLQWSSLNIFHGIINYSLWEYPSLAWT